MAFGSDDLSGTPIIPIGVAARILGMSVQRAKRWLRAHGALRKQKTGRNGHNYTTHMLMRNAFPEDADRIVTGMYTE